MELQNLTVITLAFALGGILKGATGAGAPILAVPVLAMLYDVPFAVAVFVMPNIVPNLWQAWTHRAEAVPARFVWLFAIAGGVGAAIGTLALVRLKGDILTAIVAIILIVYIIFRLTKPGWKLGLGPATRAAFPVGVVAGVLQGASGLSAPVSITFLNAVQLPRRQFIQTISVFFAGLGIVQLPLQLYLGIMTGERLLYSMLALIPLVVFMPVGTWIGRRLTPGSFDRIILIVLTGLAAKLLVDVAT